MTMQPELPYQTADSPQPTMGHSGSDASRDRAEREAVDGTASKRQQAVLSLARSANKWGVTVKDVRGMLGLHHGQASSALTVLHKANRLVRLTNRRDKCSVYVLPEFVGDRETASPRSNRRVTVDQYTDALIDAERLALALRGLVSAARGGEHDPGHALRVAEHALRQHDEEE